MGSDFTAQILTNYCSIQQLKQKNNIFKLVTRFNLKDIVFFNCYNNFIKSSEIFLTGLHELLSLLHTCTRSRIYNYINITNLELLVFF